MKDAKFYDENAAKRFYFYEIDTRGRLYLEQTTPKTIATCLKDSKFLDFFFRNYRRNDSGHFSEMPFVSYCGHEMNFVRPMDKKSAITFVDFCQGKTKTPFASLFLNDTLYYGASMTEPFDPKKLTYCSESGRLYHALDHHRYLGGELGLLHPSITENLTSVMSFNAQTNKFEISWNNVPLEIKSVKNSEA
jgi:hypothetical protein